MADLKQAMIWLAEGKKVRRITWNPEEYIECIDDKLIHTEMVEWHKGGKNWELYEEPDNIPKTLSDCTCYGEKMRFLKMLLAPNRVYSNSLHYEVLKTIESVLIDLTSDPRHFK